MTDHGIAYLALSNQAIFPEQDQTIYSIVERIQGAIDRISASLFAFLTAA